jgi:EAL domain-containing protein (putative c-di-GMP-specific phosphodiesterase class I)
MYYQPKINLQTGDVIGVEALIRWKKKDGSLVLPGNFVPVAESSKLISKISEYALFESCRQNVEWQRMGLPKIIMSINLTSVDFYQNDIKETINKILKETQMDPECLEVELTETLALKDVDMAIAQMNMLKEMGIKIAMDDFGTGYSSLSYIQVLPITLLKLDRSFIINLETDEIAREIVSSVIRIAKAKKIETIAEGIENENQVKILKESGCDHAQGFYFGKPMPAEQFVSFFSEKINNKCKVVI